MGNLVFDWEYLNGKRRKGRIIKYDKNRKLKFYGKYIEGLFGTKKQKNMILMGI